MEPSLQFDSLHDGLELLRKSVEDYQSSVTHFIEFTTHTFVEAERREAELRDDLHAVANRVESLTRMVSPVFVCDPDESGGVRDDTA